eukprot:TRINITY_DN189_c1_g1_i1.p1 TRINITY_DN189_c1_g1~~TRINITY_DN189_c1_g1_i1.p1  ORF type:complete len:263 (+),score=33.94 TRINITY_DN189_c1_g1_i1:122-910(+)
MIATVKYHRTVTATYQRKMLRSCGVLCVAVCVTFLVLGYTHALSISHYNSPNCEGHAVSSFAYKDYVRDLGSVQVYYDCNSTSGVSRTCDIASGVCEDDVYVCTIGCQPGPSYYDGSVQTSTSCRCYDDNNVLYPQVRFSYSADTSCGSSKVSIDTHQVPSCVPYAHDASTTRSYLYAYDSSNTRSLVYSCADSECVLDCNIQDSIVVGTCNGTISAQGGDAKSVVTNFIVNSSAMSSSLTSSYQWIGMIAISLFIMISCTA